MEEDNSRSSVAAALQGLEKENSKQPNEDEVNRDEEIEENDENRQLSSNDNSDCTVENASSGGRGEPKSGPSEAALVSVQLSESDFQFNESCHLLSEVPVEYSLQPLQSVEELKDQARAIHEEPLKSITGQSAQVPTQDQTQVCDGPPKQELSPISVTQPGSSLPSPSLPEQNILPVENGNNPCLTKQRDKKKSPNPRPLASLPMLKPPSDGYNWRKYGQKQVKSPEGSRSYYRCTFSDCSAKKIDCCDRSNHVIETVYRSHHNHDPPQKLNCARENKAALPVVPVNGSNDTTHSVRHLGDPAPSIFSKETLLGNNQVPETKQQESSGSDETTEINVKDEYVDGAECINRQKRSSAAEIDSFSKPGKKPKFVVHAADDMGISGDGYRWRKYGQKMVKGNPHPRNYYRCTSAGCPVRKHIERAVDNTNAVVITYKGVHDHDMPVARKRHGPKCAPLFAAATPVSVDKLQINKHEACQSQTQWSMDKEGDLTGEGLDMSGEKRSESARTLLSVGFEIKPC